MNPFDIPRYSQAATLSAYRMVPDNNFMSLQRRALNIVSYQMASGIHSSECEPFCIPRPPSPLAINGPLSERLRTELRAAAPFEREGPGLVADPVAYLVVGADVDQHTHVALEKRADVVFGTLRHVERQAEVLPDCV